MLALHGLIWTSVCSVANVKVKTANISSKLAVSSRCKQRELLQGARGIAHCVMGSNGALLTGKLHVNGQSCVDYLRAKKHYLYCIPDYRECFPAKLDLFRKTFFFFLMCRKSIGRSFCDAF